MMTYYAQIKDGVVVNCVVGDEEWVSQQDDEFTYVSYGDGDMRNPLAISPYPGCLHDEVKNEFVSPDADAPFVIMIPPEDNAEVEAMLSEILGL